MGYSLRPKLGALVTVVVLYRPSPSHNGTKGQGFRGLGRDQSDIRFVFYSDDSIEQPDMDLQTLQIKYDSNGFTVVKIVLDHKLILLFSIYLIITNVNYKYDKETS